MDATGGVVRPLQHGANMKRQVLLAMVAAALTAGIGLGRAAADEQGREKPDGWHFTLQPYAWIPLVVDGTLSAGERTVDFNLDAEDLFDVFRGGAMVQFEAWNGPVGLIVDGNWLRSEKELTPIEAPPIDITATQLWGDAMLGLSLGPPEATSLQLMAGVRGVSLKNELDIGDQISLDQDDQYAKFVAGARLPIRLSPGFLLGFRGLVNTPDIGWSLGGALILDFSWVDLRLGYRWDRIHHESNDAGFKADVHGPYVGIGFHW